MKKILAAVLICLAALTASTGVAEARPAPHSSGVAYSNGVHWWRPQGSQAQIQIQIEPSAGPMRQAYVNAAAAWSASPYINVGVKPTGVPCDAASNGCLVVAEANNYQCGTGLTFLETAQVANGHIHYKRTQLIAHNMIGCTNQYGWSPDLSYVQWVACHEPGHTLGVTHNPSVPNGSLSACNTANDLPSGGDMNIVNFLHTGGT